MSNRRSLLVIAAIILGAAGIAQVMIMVRPEPPRRPPEPEAPIVAVETVEAGSGPILVFGSGTVRPYWEIDIATEVGGKIVAVSPNLQSGGHVSAGEVLVRIDPETGRVTDYIDATDLLQGGDRNGSEVLNGIAYDPTAETFFITGKWWPKMFEVRFVE